MKWRKFFNSYLLNSHSNSRDAIYIHLSRKFTNFSLERDEAKLLLKERKEKADYLENQAQKDQQTINYWKDRYQDSAQKLSHLLDALSQETKDSMKWDSFLLRTW